MAIRQSKLVDIFDKELWHAKFFAGYDDPGVGSAYQPILDELRINQNYEMRDVFCPLSKRECLSAMLTGTVLKYVSNIMLTGQIAQ